MKLLEIEGMKVARKSAMALKSRLDLLEDPEDEELQPCIHRMCKYHPRAMKKLKVQGTRALIFSELYRNFLE